MKRKLIITLLFLSCGENATTGKQVVLRTKLTSDLNAQRSFTTNLGWNVALTQATLSTGALYYFDGEPAFTRAARGAPWRFVEALKPIHTAHAHPGHYAPGNIVGQMLRPGTFDLMADGPFTLPDGAGVTGTVRSGTFSFSAPEGGAAAMVSGAAERDGGTVYFTMAASLADIERTAADAQIPGCRFEEATITGDATVLATVKPRVWFNLVDFSQVAPGTPESPTVVDPSVVPHVAFALGLGQLSAYEFQLQP